MTDTFSSVMIGLTATITGRVMTTLGLGYLSYTALNTISTTVSDKIFSQYGMIDSTILQVLNLAGFSEALHILTAAFITKASLMAIKRIGVIPTA